MTIEEEVAAATAELQASIDQAKAREKTFVGRVKPHLVTIAFFIGALLGFILGKVHL